MDEKYEIIDLKEVKNIINCDAISPEYIYSYVLQNRAEIIYVVEKQKERLKGVISIGDILRHYEQKIELKYNTNFRYVKSNNYTNAAKVFQTLPTIHELPIIDECGKFSGVLRKGRKSDEEWNSLMRTLDGKVFGDEYAYLYIEFAKWLRNQRAKIVVYDIMPEEDWEKILQGVNALCNSRIRNKKQNENAPFYVMRNMSEKAQRDFFVKNIVRNMLKD